VSQRRPHRPAAPRPAPQPDAAAAGGGRQFTRYLWPGIAVLALAGCAALGVLLAVDGGDGGSHPQLVLETCDPATNAKCELRTETHDHADFALFIEGERFDFSQPQFVSKEGDERHPYIHIHPRRYTVVHVHRTGTTWDEFFRSLGFELTDPTLTGVTTEKTCLKLPDGREICSGEERRWRFFVNDVEVDGVAFEEIHDLDRVLISYGTAEEAAAQVATVTDQACILSLRCSARVDPNEPPEECQGGQTCTR
jgi:hypothetical protein